MSRGAEPGDGTAGASRPAALWLEPEPSAGERLGRRIADLAQRLGTPRFAPHITLSAGFRGDDQNLAERLERLAGTTGPLTLTLGEPVHSDTFFRAVVLPVAPSAELSALRRVAVDLADGGAPDKPLFEPHLSLVYGSLAPAAGRRIAAEAGNLAGRWRFSRVCAVRPGQTGADWRPVEAWRIVGRRDLRPGL